MRSNAAKRRPQLLSLPTDLLPSLGAFTSDVDAARIAISSKRARSTLTHAVWSAILRSNHGGLRIAAGDDGLRVARHLWVSAAIHLTPSRLTPPSTDFSPSRRTARPRLTLSRATGPTGSSAGRRGACTAPSKLERRSWPSPRSWR